MYIARAVYLIHGAPRIEQILGRATPSVPAYTHALRADGGAFAPGARPLPPPALVPPPRHHIVAIPRVVEHYGAPERQRVSAAVAARLAVASGFRAIVAPACALPAQHRPARRSGEGLCGTPAARERFYLCSLVLSGCCAIAMLTVLG